MSTPTAGETASESSSATAAGEAPIGPADVAATISDLKARGFDRFVDLTAVDYPERSERFELHYLLYSMAAREWRRVICRTSGRVPSIAAIFPGANACEREVYDMFGVEFDGHPCLRRILMPDDWSGHPLRRDEPLGGEEVRFTDRGPR